MNFTPIFPPVPNPFGELDETIIDTGVESMAKSAGLVDPSIESQINKYYYIITPQNLKEALSDFILWKKQKGYKIIVKTIEEILSSSTYAVNPNKTIRDNKIVDSAASLRAYLADQFALNGFFYCLLVGDSRTSMPIRKCTKIYSKKDDPFSDCGEWVVPTDAYFCDLTQKWPLRKEAGMSIYTAPVDSLGFNPTISVGRLLCTNSAEIRRWTDKVMIYESCPGYGDNEYLSSALFFEQWASEGSLINNSKQVRNYLSNYLDCTLIQDAHYLDNSKFGPTGDVVIKEISKVGLSSWHGHGNPAGICCSYGGNYVTAEDSVINVIQDWKMKDIKGNGLDNLTNINKPSVVYSISCINTPFDCLKYYSGYEYNIRYNLGSGFTVGSDVGGPVFLGNTRSGLSVTSTNLELNFFKEIVKNPKIGIAENKSKINLSDVGYGLYVKHTHNIVGDPEISLWFGKPQGFDPSITLSSSRININHRSLEGAKISLYDGINQIIPFVASSSNAQLILSGLPTVFDKTCYVLSIWKDGFLPSINFIGQNSSITNKVKSFIVNDASLGSPTVFSMPSEYFSIESGGLLKIKALNRISTYDGFIVKDKGTAVFNCKNNVYLQGGTIENNGKLNVTAHEVTLYGGFSIEKGGVLTICNN